MQTTLHDRSFVVTKRNEQVGTRRTAYGDFCVRQRTGHCDGVGKQHPSPRLQQSGPLGNHLSPVGKMVDRVNAGDCIKRGVGERQSLCRIRNLKFSAWGQAPLSCERSCCRNGLLMNVNPHYGTAGLRGHAQPRTTGSTSNIQERFAWRKCQPAQETVLLVRGMPTVLSNIPAKSFAPDLLIQLGLEISVGGVVLAAAGMRLRFGSSIHSITRSAPLRRVEHVDRNGTATTHPAHKDRARIIYFLKAARPKDSFSRDESLFRPFRNTASRDSARCFGVPEVSVHCGA